MQRPLTVLALLLLLGGQAQAGSMRCGTQLVSEGDRAFEVERKCGPPAYRDLIGYTTGGYDQYDLKIEEWVYGPHNGMLSILTFEGNRLVRIETRRGR